MSSDKDTTDYIELRPGDRLQVGDQWLDQFGQWHFYTRTVDTQGAVVDGVRARRPIWATHQTTYEEVPGSRTTQQAIDQPQRERIAYEELRPGTEVQAGDQYRNTQGRWVEYTMDTSGVPIVGPTAMARRPYNISTILEISDALASAQKAATQLQDERNEARKDRDLARSEVARLSSELWARKPLEDRVASLTEELAQAREANQQLLQTIADNADQFANAGKILEQQRDEVRAELGVALARVIATEHNLAETKKDAARIAQEYAEWSKEAEAASSQLQHERDEARAEVQRLQEVVGNLYSEPTARQVQDMLRAWATELDWSAGCFDSAGREQIDTIQKTLVAVIERIETMINPEGNTDDE